MIPRKYQSQIHNDGSRSSGIGRGPQGRAIWDKVHKLPGPNACWEWTGYVDKDGAGKLTTVGGKTVRPHRYIYGLAYGVVDAATPLVHQYFTNPKCVRPDHRLAMTFQAMGQRFGGTVEPTDNRGDMNGSARLTEEDVHEIRSWRGVYGACPLLARLYGMSIHYVRVLMQPNRCWKHLPFRHGPRGHIPLRRLRELVEQREQDAREAAA